MGGEWKTVESPERHAPEASSRKPLKAYLLLGLAVITCPCHLPLLLAVLAGTALAGSLSQYFGLAFLGLTVIFVPALYLGLRALREREQRRT